MRGALLLSLSILFSAVLSPPVTALEIISSGRARTVTVAMDSHDAYQVVISGDKTASIEFTADSIVDFYVMTASGYAEYTDPNSSVFHTKASQENAQSFSYSTIQSGLIFVVDNADITTTGTTPTKSVTYVITVLFTTTPPPETGPTAFSIAVAAIAGVGVFGAIAFVLLRQRRKRQSTPVSQAVMPPPPPPRSIPPPPPGVSAAPTLPVKQTAQTGTVRRSLNGTERDMLIQDFKNQKRKAAILPAVGLVLAVVQIMFGSLITIGLTLPAFIAPVIASQFAKLRRAIVAGKVVEFQGVPVVLGTHHVGKQNFHRLQFGPETVSVSSSLYGRFVPNQANSLTVLEGANKVLAVNGVPLPLPSIEQVRFSAPTKTLMGMRS